MTLDDAKRIAQITSAGLEAIETVIELIRGLMGGTGAGAPHESAVNRILGYVHVLASVADATRDGLAEDSPLTAEHVAQQIQTLTSSIATNDAEAAAALAAKFPPASDR